LEDYDEEEFTIVGMAEDSEDNDDLDIIPLSKTKKEETIVEKDFDEDVEESENEFTISGNVEDENNNKVDENEICDDEILDELNRYKKANNIRTTQAIHKINKYYEKRKLYMKRRWMVGFIVVTIVIMLIISGIIT
jgi:hypothetical protein